MAGASMNDIKARIKSVSGTMQITKAMELVATSKLRLAKERAERTSGYEKAVAEAIKRISASSEYSSSVWTKGNDAAPTLYIVIAGDRGLAGGFNSSLFKLTRVLDKADNSLYLPIGKKAQEYYRRREAIVYDGSFAHSQDVGVGECLNIAERICSDFLAGKVGRVVLVHTEFVSMLTQLPRSIALLPLSEESERCDAGFDPIYEGDPVELLEAILPDYIGGRLYSAACQSYASELAARRQAMNSANKNAEEMIASLRLKFNRARQAVITQEITEIVSGAEAL